MAGPSTREVSPRGQAAGSSSTANDFLGIVLLLAIGLALRFIIAYRLLPGSGFPNDLGAFKIWASDMAQHGTTGFYSPDPNQFLDYPPVYLIFLSWLGKLFAGRDIGDGIKLIPIFADLALAFVVWMVARDLGASKRRAYAAAAIVVFNPITWLNSAIWGQADAVGSVFLVIGLRELIKDRRETAAALAVVATLTKLQLGILGFLVGLVILRRSLWPKTGSPDPLRVASSIGAGLLTAALICLPFTGLDVGVNLRRLATHEGQLTLAAGLLAGSGVCLLILRWASAAFPDAHVGLRLGAALIGGLGTLSLFGSMVFDLIVRHVLGAFGEYPYLTVNAYNPWALVSTPDQGAMDQSLSWIRDAAYTNPEGVTEPGLLIGRFSGAMLSTIGLVLALLVVGAIAAWLVARELDAGGRRPAEVGDAVDEPDEARSRAGSNWILSAEMRAFAVCCAVAVVIVGFLLFAHVRGGVSAQIAGDMALIAVLVGIGSCAAWRDDARSITVALAVLAIAFFVVPTRAHERYLFPFFGVGTVLLAVSWRWTIAYLALAAANLVNLMAVLVQYCGIPSNVPYACMSTPVPLHNGNQQLASTFIDWGGFLRMAVWPASIDWTLLLVISCCALGLALGAAWVWGSELGSLESPIWLLAIVTGILGIVIWLGPAKIIWPIELAGIVTGIVLVWAMLQLRDRAVVTLAQEAARAAGPTGPPARFQHGLTAAPSEGDEND